MRSASALARLAGMALLAAHIGLRAIFLLASGTSLVGALNVPRIPGDLWNVVKPRLVFKRRYALCQRARSRPGRVLGVAPTG